MRTTKTHTLWLLCLFLLACGDDAPRDEVVAAPMAEMSSPLIEVKTTTAVLAPFPLRTFSAGRLEARQKAELRFRAAGMVEEFDLREGQSVQEGQLLGKLDDIDLQHQLQQKQTELAEAEFQKKDLIVRWGGDHSDDASVPLDVLENIHVQTGINRIRKQMEHIRYRLKDKELYAPFSGVVTEVKMRQYQAADPGSPVCTLINPRTFEASFEVLEREAVQLRKGQRVKIRPLALPDKEYIARISIIGPNVDKHGLVTVKAALDTDGKSLFEGMNIEVVIEQSVGDFLTVPKTAVVLRSNKEVIFNYDPATRLAKWNYVSIAHENDSEYAISEGLQEGMEVIIEGNTSLDHDSEVKMINNAGK